MKKFLKPSYIIIIVIVLLVVIIRIALPGIVKNYVNKKLNELPGYTGHVADIDIHLIRGAYVIKDLELRKKKCLLSSVRGFIRQSSPPHLKASNLYHKTHKLPGDFCARITKANS